MKNALNNIFGEKKQKNSLIHSRKLILGHRITGELNEYKKHIWTVAFLILKLFPVSILLGICRLLPCVQNVFTWILSGDRSGRFYQPHLMVEEIKCFGIQDLPQTVTTVSFFWHRMRDLTAALYRPPLWVGRVPQIPCLHDCPPGAWGCCLFRSHEFWLLGLWKAWAGHEWKLTSSPSAERGTYSAL